VISLVCAMSVGLTACSSGSSTPSTHGGSTTGSSLPASLSGYPTSAEVDGHVNDAVGLRTFPDDFQAQLQQLINFGFVPGSIYPEAKPSGCELGSPGSSLQPVNDCTGGDSSSKHVLALIGDSRTGMWASTFDNVGYLSKWKIVNFQKAGCPVGLANFIQPGMAKTGTPWQDCGTFHQNLIKEMAVLKPEVIVISSQTQWILTTPAPNHPATPAETRAALAAFIRELPSSSRVVVLAGFPTPGFTKVNPSDCLGRSPKAPSDCNFTEHPAVAASNEAFKGAAADTGAGYIDQGPWFCTSACPSIINGLIVYTKDAYHANGRYLNTLAGALHEALAPYMGS